MRSNLQALLLFLLSPLAASVAYPSPALTAGRDNQGSELLRYIQSEGANPACGVCLGAAQKYFSDKEKSEVAKLTGGMVRVESGRYRLGSPDSIGDPDEHPSEEIALDAFYIDRAEVSIKDYMQFVTASGANHPEWAAPNGRFNMTTGTKDYYKRLSTLVKACTSCPVFGVSWENANAYCHWKKRRLPTEAEWEAAARAGTGDPYPSGLLPVGTVAYAWILDNAKSVPHPAAQKKPNRLGLYDMYGNVWEWVGDFYDKDYYARRSITNPDGPKTGKEHAIRGGAWSSDMYSARPGNRASSRDANDDIGFRCAVSETALLAQIEADSGF